MTMTRNFNEKNRKPYNNGMEKKYTPKTNKPRPTTYDLFIETGEKSFNDALDIISTNIPEMSNFVNFIRVPDDEETTLHWFDETITNVANYFGNIVSKPQLYNKSYVHTRLSLDVNGFSVRFEDNVTLDVHCKYVIEDGSAKIISTKASITLHGKVSKQTYEYLRNPEHGWLKKSYDRKGTKYNNKYSEE